MQRTDGPLYLNKNFTVRLSGLTAGEHSVFVTQTGSYDLVMLIYPQNVSSAIVYFSVALSPPRILPTSPQNQSYEVANVPLEFTAETDYGAVSWMGFSLDGQDNVTIAGNTTLTGLPNGYHSAVVYTNGTFGKMGKSETINFTINGETESEPFPIAPIAITAAGASTAVVATGLVIHFTKRRRQTRRL